MYYCEPLLDSHVFIIIKDSDYKNNNTLNQYFCKAIWILHEYPSTGGLSREFLSKNSVLLYAPASILSFLNLLDIKIELVLNSNNVNKKIKDCHGSSFSISC